MTIFIFLLAAIGLFNVLCGALKLPPRMTSQRLRSVSGKSHFFDSLRQKMLLPIIGIVAPFIRLDEFKLRRMKNKLERAEMPFTPQEYYARSVVIAAAVFIAGGIMSAVMMPKMILVMAVLAGIVYYHFTDEVNDKLKAKDALIENELPKFIRAIVQGLKTEKDIIKLLETYGTIAEKGLQYDIEVLIMDLKSGNFENGR